LNSQAFLTMQPLKQFVIHQSSCPTEQDIQKLMTVMGTTAGQVPQSGAELARWSRVLSYRCVERGNQYTAQTRLWLTQYPI
ncbi:MAG: hypothetical protein ACK6CE_01465, partial [Planctomycetota bacterium]